MKKLIIIIAVPALSFALSAQEISHKLLVINIEVPVRVFKGSSFVDDLTIKDFEIYEEVKLQKIEAVYLIKKTNIEREEAKKKFAPEVSRNFVLLFEIHEYLPKIGDALDYFFDNVILPGDNLKVVTPIKTYNFNKKAFEILSKQEISKQLKKKLRKDAKFVSMEYRSLLKCLEDIMSSDFDTKLMMYKDTVRILKDLRYLDEKKLMDFADFLKNMEGQKYVFFFYQKETIPVLRRKDSDLSLEDFEIDISFDVEKVKQAFADSSISSNFLYITKTAAYQLDVTRMQATEMPIRDQSWDIFSAFKEIAQATGGFVDSSANAASLFKRAVDASENYYLLYYAPKNYKADGKFKKIKVKVKNKNYRISHRAGYLAN